MTGGTVLVTGATGFVGRALCPALSEAGWTARPAGRAETGDIGPETDWRPLLSGVAAVIHLAAHVHAMRRDPADSAAQHDRINRAGTVRLAEQAAAAGVRRFVLLSSVKVHGDRSDRPLTAADPPAPTDDYGRSKAAAEAALQGHADRMETVILRPPLVYGPGVRGNFLSLTRLVDRGWPLPLANIDNRRSLIYLGNLASAICAALDANTGVYLPSDRDDLSTPDLIRRLAAALGRPARLFPAPPVLLRVAAGAVGRAAAIDRLCGSLTVDGRLPGWQPMHGVTDGLAATADWYRAAKAAIMPPG